MLNSSLDARKAHPGQQVSARILQNVVLPDGRRIPTGSRVLGRIVEVAPPSAGSGSHLVLSFDQVVVHGNSTPVAVSLRAMASMMEVYEAQIPTNALDDYETSSADWNTVQVGGAGVFRGSRQVMAADQVIGTATVGGDVKARLLPVPGLGCRGAAAGNDREQALWVFSPSACGTYGFRDLKIL